jgi:DNA (cytosine-5)-methyltransferase 1
MPECRAYYNEIDAKKAAWLRELISRGLIAPGDVDERSIAAVRGDDLRGYRQCHFFAGIGIWSYALGLAGWPEEREVWTGSCPCQPFSAAGKRQAFHDERHLWAEFFRLIEARRPLVVFGEQVSSVDGLAWLDAVQADLDDAGYACGVLDACAAGVGAPHRRQRLYWVADAGDAGLEERNGAGEPPAGKNSPPRPAIELSRPARGLAGSPVGDPEGVGRRRRPDYVDGGRRECAPGQTGPVNGFWRSADWVLTRPQRVGDSPGLRPIEPGSFPLADGASQRMGRLRGYGDGIVAQNAAAFIAAYLEIT